MRAEEHGDLLGGSLPELVVELSEARSLGELCRRAAHGAVRLLDFTRAGVFLLDDGHIVPAGLAFDGADALLAVMTAPRPPLALLPPEAEMVRTGRPMIVDASARAVYRPFVDTCGAREYAGAPLMAGGHAHGVILADRSGSPRPLAAPDRDALWGYASVVALALGHRQALDGIAAARAALGCPDTHRTGGMAELDRSAGERYAGLYGLLTRRELEVLPLLAEGHTTREIAERLSISESTAKTHLAHILRKLEARNRADAVRRATELLAA